MTVAYILQAAANGFVQKVKHDDGTWWNVSIGPDGREADTQNEGPYEVAQRDGACLIYTPNAQRTVIVVP